MDSETALIEGDLWGTITCSMRYKYNPVNTLTEFFGRRTSRDVIEAVLAYVVGNWVEAAYARSDRFERRRVLIDDWAHNLAQGSEEDSKS